MGVTASHALEKRLEWLARLQGSYTIIIKKLGSARARRRRAAAGRARERGGGRRVVDRHKYFNTINYSFV